VSASVFHDKYRTLRENLSPNGCYFVVLFTMVIKESIGL
jgi:hypothetical protein